MGRNNLETTSEVWYNFTVISQRKYRKGRWWTRLSKLKYGLSLAKGSPFVTVRRNCFQRSINSARFVARRRMSICPTSGLGCKILSTTIGGANGGGAQLTEAGQHLLHEYKSAKAQIDLTLQEHVDSFSRSFWIHRMEGYKIRIEYHLPLNLASA